jgi:Arc/MetJ family transcription regulator
MLPLAVACAQVPTNLTIDDALIEAAKQAGQHKTKKEAVTAALKEYVDKRPTRRNPA